VLSVVHIKMMTHGAVRVHRRNLAVNLARVLYIFGHVLDQASVVYQDVFISRLNLQCPTSFFFRNIVAMAFGCMHAISQSVSQAGRQAGRQAWMKGSGN